MYNTPMEKENSPESPTQSTAGGTSFITLQKAIELGEYEPVNLAKFDEWHKLSQHAQFQLIRKGLDNHEHQLMKEWAEINNVLDFSKKPQLQTVLRNIEARIRQVHLDRERLYMEFIK